MWVCDCACGCERARVNINNRRIKKEHICFVVECGSLLNETE